LQAGGHRFDPVHLHQKAVYKLVSLIACKLFCSLTTEGKSKKGQVRKGIWWMPWHQEAKKDAAGCEKPRGAASERRTVDVRMGQPIPRKVGISLSEYIG
jgi:hypothetical protein